MQKSYVLGIDIGGSGVKGGIVDIKKGELVGERVRIPTPKSHEPKAVVEAIAQIAHTFKWNGIIGCGFPGVIRSQVVETAANLGGKKFIGTNLAELIGEVDGVIKSHSLRVRSSGDTYEIDVNIHVAPTLSIVEAHDISERVEKVLREKLGKIMINVHVEPQ